MPPPHPHPLSPLKSQAIVQAATAVDAAVLQYVSKDLCNLLIFIMSREDVSDEVVATAAAAAKAIVRKRSCFNSSHFNIYSPNYVCSCTQLLLHRQTHLTEIVNIFLNLDSYTSPILYRQM